jgi:hypothetical protein
MTYRISKNDKIEDLLNLYGKGRLELLIVLPKTMTFLNTEHKEDHFYRNIQPLLWNLDTSSVIDNHTDRITHVKIYFTLDPHYIFIVELCGYQTSVPTVPYLILTDGSLEDIIDNVIEYQINKYKQYGT